MEVDREMIAILADHLLRYIDTWIPFRSVPFEDCRHSYKPMELKRLIDDSRKSWSIPSSLPRWYKSTALIHRYLLQCFLGLFDKPGDSKMFIPLVEYRTDINSRLDNIEVNSINSRFIRPELILTISSILWWICPVIPFCRVSTIYLIGQDI